MNRFAYLWPDELATGAPLRDLGYSPRVSLSGMVDKILAAHEVRNVTTAEAFKAVGEGGGAVFMGVALLH
jgi:hypothetical protein